ncbi:hypothetical protein [Hymenobacter antarcticus]|uniref:ABC transporter permease n=1 Tax=Hymenobacter antarcticus TaxID=486270 RepID=A0ABP7QH32_9BACT
MSQLFDFARFGRLFRKHTAEHLRSYLMSTVVLLGGIGLVLGYVAYLNTQAMVPSVQGVVFILGLLSSGTFFTSTVLAEFGNQRQATAALMLPASHWEKYLVAWLYALPIFLLVYIGCFYLMDSLVLQFDDWAGPRPELVSLFSSQDKIYASLVAYALLSAAFLWGSIFFRKQQFVRTAFVLLLGGVVLAVVNFQAQKWLIGQGLISAIPYSTVKFQDGTTGVASTISLTEAQLRWLVVVPVGMLLLSWAGAYTRLTEKQL